MKKIVARFLVLICLTLSGGLVAKDSSSTRSGLAAKDATSDAVRSLDAVPAYSIAGGKGTAAILFDAGNGSPDSAVTVLTFKKGTAVPEHKHDTSTEFLYVLQGQAEMVLAGKPLKLRKEQVIRIPRNVIHSAKIVSDEDFVALQIYTPAGPEQRFRPKAEKK